MTADSNLQPILCVGDLVADIFSSPINSLPLPGECIMTDDISVFPGGNALNIAMAINQLGEQVKISGDIGDDLLGSLLTNHLESRGIETSAIRKIKGSKTASTFIFRLSNEDRRFISNLGVSKDFTGREVNANDLPTNGILVVAGYLKLLNWDDGHLKELLKIAKSKNNKVLLNISYIQDSNVDPKRCFDLLEDVDFFVLNDDEAKLITGETNNAEQGKAFKEGGASNIIITKGSEGLYAENVSLSVRMQSINVPLVDPTGCGDCFVAGLLTSLRRNLDFLTMLKYGTALGALSATSLGCTTGIPNYQDVEKFLLENNIEYTAENL